MAATDIISTIHADESDYWFLKVQRFLDLTTTCE